MEILKEILNTIIAWTGCILFIIAVFYVIIGLIIEAIKNMINVFKGKPSGYDTSLPWDIRKFL